MTEPLREAVRKIFVSWDDWDAEAGQQAQQAQLPEAYDFAMQARLQAVLEDLIEQAAKVCEGRAKHMKNQIPVYNEAMKCADQIRHNLLGPMARCTHCRAKFRLQDGDMQLCHECGGTFSRRALDR